MELPKQSEFNMSLDYLQKISYLLWICTQSALQLEPFSWFLTLQALKRTLIADITEPDKKEILKLEGEIEPLLTKFQANKNKKNVLLQPELYRLLEEFEMKIYLVLDKAGLLRKLKEMPEYALAGGD